MKLIDRRASVALLVVCGLALGPAACGDDGGGDSPPAAANSQSVAASPGDATSDERARATLTRFYAAIHAADGEAVCAELTEKAQSDVAQGTSAGTKRACSEALQPVLDQIAATTGVALRSFKRVKSVKIGGDTAVATVVFDRGKPVEIPLKHVDGDWRLISLGMIGS